jgi:23S rRNA (guanine2445-N2)-methyltransferase / 23S rRNA (guanine2069-N7)-methyltransferase
MTSDDHLGKRIGLRATRRRRVYNGAIACRLLELPVGEPRAPSQQRTMLANRLRKRFEHLRRWARRRDIHCYRVYDADLPEYAAAIDLYGGWAVVQEYEPPATVPAARAAERLADLIAVVPEVLEVERERVVVKVRHRQRGKSQYGRRSRAGELEEIQEGGHRFLVNLRDYVDTGLFLDGRRIRALIGKLAAGRRFLNLFAYTGTATVYAARGGATASTSVDMSKTYLDWARRNLRLNGIGERHHELVAADCVAWLSRAGGKYGLIYMDPPTYSTSKRMRDPLDLPRDHAELLRAAVRLLAPGGVLLFSTHARQLRLEPETLPGFRVDEITRRTVDEDFARGRAPHRCWQITRG